MQYLITKDFTKINETSGTVQNTDNGTIIEVSNKATADSGVLLYPLNKFSFNGETLYLRCVEGNFAEARVVPFHVDAGGSGASSGGGSNVDDSNVATDEQIDDLLDDIFG